MGAAFELFGEREVQPALNRLKSHLQPHVHLTLLMRNPQSDDGDAIWSLDDLQAVEDAVRRFKEKDQPSFGESELEKLRKFKEYVHARLDRAGVPREVPESPHTAAGCRIGGRLDWLLACLKPGA